ncbi:hypothetical protein DVA86_33590 [Streptomyces armeniacus]|uniref:Peptide chain release factor 1 n=1 Tax=Streptomyces armeniacus TaxID=83291 RepID=A0A345XYP2_9ACTN|nr:hypothetical protein [Streptomyces armeniacus]AXK36758.1 hypothetical protein DVA86_33590 [Streptomyces armeniacus]
MDLSRLRPVYEHDGPFATVYLEGRAPAEDAAKQVRLRWQALRERLEADGADPRAVDAAEAAARTDTPGEEQADGRVIVAHPEAGVVLDEHWDAALGAGDAAHWGHLPELGAYGREAARAVRALVVLADREGARVRQEVVAEQHTPETRADEEVEGGALEGVHKPREGGLSHRVIQHRAENAVSRNAQDVADYVARTADTFHPRVVILAGEVQARTAVRDALPAPLRDTVTETSRGGAHAGSSDEALTDEVLRIAERESTADAEEQVDRLRSGLGHDRAAEGSQAVGAAAEMGAVDTLLLEDGAAASREAFLLRNCAESASTLTVAPAGTGLKDGVGALLRFPLEQSTPG